MISINKKLKDKILFSNKYNYIYADFTGSGQASPIIEHIICKNILPYYANIHSNSFFSKKMSKYIKYTKDYIKNYMNVSNDQVIIFTGNGSTGSFNHIIRSIDYNNYEKFVIFVFIRFGSLSFEFGLITKLNEVLVMFIKRINIPI